MTPFQWPGFTRMNCASRFLLAAVGVLLGVDGFQTCLELHSVLSCSTFGKQLFIILQFGGAHLHVPSIARERRKKTDCRVLVNHASHDLPSRGSFWAPSPPSLRGMAFRPAWSCTPFYLAAPLDSSSLSSCSLVALTYTYLA